MIILFIQLIMIIIAVGFGGFIFLQPRRIIDMQISFYRLINWDIKPVSMEKEIRNTRIMGAAALILGILSLIYIIFSINNS